jgi:hypothetical protein
MCKKVMRSPDFRPQVLKKAINFNQDHGVAEENTPKRPLPIIVPVKSRRGARPGFFLLPAASRLECSGV